MTTTQKYFEIAEEVGSSPQNALVLVGTALDGPSMTPFRPNTLYNIEDIIGDCPLAIAYNYARVTGLSDVILFRINGLHATATLKSGEVPIIEFQSVSANTSYNAITIEAQPDRLVVTSSIGELKDYYYQDYPSAGLMADAINLDAHFGLVEFVATALVPSFLMINFGGDSTTTVLFTGGATEEDLIPDRKTGIDISTTIDSLKMKLNEALFGEDLDDQLSSQSNSILGLMDYGVICLVDMFHDDSVGFTDMLSRFCYNKFLNTNNGSVGVIGTKPLYDVTDITKVSKLSSLLSTAPTLMMGGAAVETESLVSVDIKPMAYVQVVIGDLEVPTIAVNRELASLAYSYAATAALLPYNYGMTNKSLLGVSTLNYEFSKEDIDNLASNGYISIVSSIRKGNVPYMAVTALGSKAKSMTKSPSTLRTSCVISRAIAEYLDGYIGETSVGVSRKQMEQGLVDLMKIFADNQIIKDFDMKFDYLNSITEVYIKISYVPFTDLTNVTSVVRMPFNQGVIR
jgi:hypothetical protein